WFSVAAAPSVNGYSAYAGYAPQDTTHALRARTFTEDHITSFSVGLTPGEVRIFRVVPDPQNAHAARLAYPVGGETWIPGERQTVTWTGITANATVRLYTDQVSGTARVGPYVELAAGVSGTSASITVPGVVTARGRIVVTGTGADAGALLTATHQLPLRVGQVTSAEVVRTNLLATYGYAFSALVHTPAGPQ